MQSGLELIKLTLHADATTVLLLSDARQNISKPCPYLGTGDNHTEVNHEQPLTVQKDRYMLQTDREGINGEAEQRKCSQCDSKLSILLFQSVTPTSFQARAVATC